MNKFIALALGLLILSNSAFAVGPIGVSGQNQTLNKYPSVIKAPNNLATDLGSSTSLIENGNKNILANPSFEYPATPTNVANATSWLISSGVTPSTEISIVLDGKKSLMLSPGSLALDLNQDSTLYAAQFADGVQGLAMMRVKTSVTSTPVYVCPRTAGAYPTTMSSGCVQVQANGKWGLYKVPFVLGGTSNGIGLTSNGVGLSGLIYVDDAFVGAVDLKADTLIQTQDYVATLTSANVPSSVTKNTGSGLFSVSNVGNRIRFTALKNITIDGSGSYEVSGAGGAGAVSIWYINGNSRNVDRVVSNNNASNSGSASLNTTLLAGEYVEFEGAVYAVGAYASANVSLTATSTINSATYSSTCGANCVEILSLKASSAGAISDPNVSGWATFASATGSNYTFTPQTNLFTVTPNCWAEIQRVGTSSTALCRVTDATTSSSIVVRCENSSTGADLTTPFKLFCQKQGADFVATRTIQGSFREVVTTSGSSKPVIFSAFVNTNGAITSNKGNIITTASCTTGNWSVNFGVTLASLPTCLVGIASANNFHFDVSQIQTTTTGLSFLTPINNSTYSCADAVVVLCHGETL